MTAETAVTFPSKFEVSGNVVSVIFIGLVENLRWFLQHIFLVVKLSKFPLSLVSPDPVSYSESESLLISLWDLFFLLALRLFFIVLSSFSKRSVNCAKEDSAFL